MNISLENWLRKKLEENEKMHDYSISTETVRILIDEYNQISQPPAISWVEFDWNRPETRPTQCKRYLICRKDGKIHWEKWNGSGWAYNHNEIRYWAVIVPPVTNGLALQIEKIIKDNNLTTFQILELSKLREMDIEILDYSINSEDNDLMIKTVDNDILIENYMICERDDVFISIIGKSDSSLDKIEKIN